MSNIDIITPLSPTERLPVVRMIGFGDLWECLSRGLDDFRAMPTQVLFVMLVYPVVGLVLGRFAFGYDIVPLLYPLAAGFALIGPFAAIGMYELSRRREQGLDTSWSHMLDVFHSPSLRSILALGGMLLVLFAFWLVIAQSIYVANFGEAEPHAPLQFLHSVVTTREGFNLIVLGNLAGLLFAIAAFSLSVISFPLLLDRNVGVAVALATSVKAVTTNPLTMAAWGVIVALVLVVGMLPLFTGLAVAVPILGHATWHLYRKVVEPDVRPRPRFEPAEKLPRYAADFPAVLLTLFDRGRKS